MISIAMAAYNGEKYIREQLESILSQTIQDFELVVCDDCSTDSTLSILREYEANDSRIHVFANEKNLGFKKNFEKAISLCTGDYIALSDQDDIWYPEHLEVLYNSLTAGGGGIVLFVLMLILQMLRENLLAKDEPILTLWVIIWMRIPKKRYF